MATTNEDFSFPAAPPLCFVTSPPTWWRSSSSSGDQNCKDIVKGKEVQDGSEKFDLCSTQELKASSAIDAGDNGDQEEEKMDILWEDLNEESSRNCGKTAKSYDISSPGRGVHMSCVNVKATLKLTKADHGYVFSRKKPSVIVFIKLLKKVFVMQNSRRSIKKRAW